MSKSPISGFLKRFSATGFAFFLFGAFAIIWFYVFNRYAILYYQEQIQLFRFDSFYLLSFFDRPGGLSEYLGAFLTQFYYYPIIGAIILTTIICSVVLIFYNICRLCCNAGKMFFITFIPGVLLLTSFANIFFEMSAVMGFLVALAGFRLYIKLSIRIRYFAGFMLVAAAYFIAGGNALLLTILILIFEMTGGDGTRIIRLRSLQVTRMGLLCWGFLLPWISWRLIYNVSMQEAFFALTPFNFYLPSIDVKLLWLSIPVLFLMGRIIAVRGLRTMLRLRSATMLRLRSATDSAMTARIPILNFILVILITAGFAFSTYNLRSNTINRMAFDLHNSDYNSVLDAGKDNPTNNRLICYLTNIALYETGQMPYRLFHYKQMGTAGLLLNWEYANSSTLVWYLGEVYYRLGMMLQAEHCAFESFVSSHKGLDARVLQRLTLTNIARRDSATAGKYLRYLDRSLFYRQWAHQQRLKLALAMADSTFQIPGIPMPVRGTNFFIPYQMPEYTLLSLLESNPKHRMAFEYLMAYCMLQRDLKKVKWCMDNYYRYFDYPSIPAHYEEALLLYKNVYNEGPDFFKQYPVSNATLERYERYMQAVKLAQGNKSKFEQFQKRFSNTFWYYMNLIDPARLLNN